MRGKRTKVMALFILPFALSDAAVDGPTLLRRVLVIGHGRPGGNRDNPGGSLELQPVAGLDARSALDAQWHHQLGFLFESGCHGFQNLLLKRAEQARTGSIASVRLSEGAQRIAHHNVLPAQSANSEIVTFGEVATVIVSRQDELGTRRQSEVRLVYMARGARRAFQDVIGGERLRAAVEPCLGRFPVPANGPMLRRARESAAVGGDVLGRDGARQPMEAEEAAMAVRVVRSPARVADDIGLIVENLRGL